MHVEMRPISTIRPYENNPRLNDAAVDTLAASIREFGWSQPIVDDENSVIIVGHGRYKAALKLGLETVPVHVATGLTPEQVKAYRIADNKTAELSYWNYDLLPIEPTQLQRAVRWRRRTTPTERLTTVRRCPQSTTAMND